MLRRTGFRSAARLTLQEAARLYPGLVEPWLALGHLEREGEAWQASRASYEKAIALDQTSWTAHQGLAYVLEALGDAEDAACHRDLGFGARPHVTIPCLGTQSPVRILLLASTTGGDTPWAGLLNRQQYQVEVVASEYWDTTAPLPRHDIIINAVSDADAAWSAMQAAERLVRVSGRPVINSPQVLRGTGRQAVSERLKGIAEVETARIIRCSKKALLSHGREVIAQAGLHFPILVRSIGHHTGRHFERVEDVHGIPAAMDRLAGEDLWVLEWLPSPHGGDMPYRKYRVMMIGGRLYPVHAAWSHDWKVHYFSRADTELSQEIQERFLHDMGAALGPRAMSALAGIQMELGLDYGGVDFDVLLDGRVRVFEANATMVVPPEKAILSAVSQLIESRIGQRC